MSRAAVVVLVLLAFASGIGSGFVLGRSRAVHGIDIATPAEVLDAMAEEVGLSPEQKAACAEIQKKYHPAVVKLKLSIRPEQDKIHDASRAEMSEKMTEEQRARFKLFYTHRDQQRAAQEK